MAVGWQIFQLTNDALFLGFAGLAEAIPAIGIALYAGHIADVVDRKKIAIVSIVLLVFILGGLSFCSYQFARHSLLVWIIFAVIAASGFVRGFYGPAVFGLLGDIVPRELFGNAAAWNSASWQSSAVAGRYWVAFFICTWVLRLLIHFVLFSPPDHFFALPF